MGVIELLEALNEKIASYIILIDPPAIMFTGLFAVALNYLRGKGHDDSNGLEPNGVNDK